MKYFSMFSGTGGFEYGIKQTYSRVARKCQCNSTAHGRQEEVNGSRVGNTQINGNNELSGCSTQATCIGFSEIDKYAKQIYKKHWEHKDYGDCTKINWGEVEGFDMLVGGFPCQAFSIAGNRQGFNDTRGTLFFEIARCIREKQPRLFLLENVKGLLSHDKGNTFLTILTTLDELGYDLQWQVLNSKNFGVPQNRERVFIVGHLRGTSRQEVFPIGSTDRETNIRIIAHRKNYRRNYQVYDSSGQTEALDTGQGGGRGQHIAIPVLTPDRPEKRQNGRRFKEDGDPAFTLTAQDRHGIYNGNKIRRLTPTECERLQGFPDGWTEKGVSNDRISTVVNMGKIINNNSDTYVQISDTQRYKCLGNAVTVNVIEAIMERLLDE